jgi:hypothetical protein
MGLAFQPRETPLNDDLMPMPRLSACAQAAVAINGSAF